MAKSAYLVAFLFGAILIPHQIMAAPAPPGICDAPKTCPSVKKAKIELYLLKDKNTILPHAEEWQVQIHVHGGSVVGARKSFGKNGKAVFEVMTTGIKSYATYYGPNGYVGNRVVDLSRSGQFGFIIECPKAFRENKSC